ncbi:MULTISPECIES: SpoIIE family protein phosphatase [unclassified Nocardioides]|uniref:SpoIIE family protein phosphatase n=1 Tax=unclassified Nocardioides TaxID=2615069 RepID=UPI003618339D
MATKAASFDQSSQIMLVVEGPELRLAAVNERARALLGERPLGVPLRQAYPELAGQQIYEAYEHCYRTGESFVLGEWHTHYRAPDGDSRELYLDLSVTPLRSAEGDIVGVVGEGRDVTTKVRARLTAEQDRDAATQHLAEARLVARVVQEAHLPLALPVLPRLDIAARYLLAAEDSAAGGDWFDAVLRPDGRIALVVGDVVGHGTTASAVMGQLRAVCHERLTSPAPLADAMSDVDRFARVVPGARHATLCVVELDPVTGTGQYCTAGHPPPLVLAGGAASFLSPSGAGPLATTGVFPTRQLRLDTADTLLVLYTDGLLERPGRTPAASTVELADAVTQVVAGTVLAHGAPRRTPERVCEVMLDLMIGDTGYGDDITLLAAELTPPREPLHMVLDAVRTAPSEARHRLAEWLEDMDVTADDRLALAHAVNELVTNTVEHAYADDPKPGQATVDLSHADDGAVHLRIADGGTWQEGPGPESRGLQMVRTFLDSLEVHATDDGTVVTGTYRLRRPAILVTGAAPAVPLRQWSDPPFVLREEAGHLTLRGPVLAPEADELHRRLDQLTAARASVTLDLAGVTHLGSAAVRVLHEAITTDHGSVTLLAPVGSVAQHVLDLVELPHQASLSDDGHP